MISSNAEDDYTRTKREYLSTLKRSELKFAISEKNIQPLEPVGNEAVGNLASLIIIGDQDNDLDWRMRFETYLEERKDSYFWAKELLE